MLSLLRRRLATGFATTRYPAVSEPSPDAFRGMPTLVDASCRGDGACADMPLALDRHPQHLGQLAAHPRIQPLDLTDQLALPLV
jgi:hypothetical protein